MAFTLEQLEAAAMALPERDRLRLGEALLTSALDPELERIWLREMLGGSDEPDLYDADFGDLAEVDTLDTLDLIPRDDALDAGERLAAW